MLNKSALRHSTLHNKHEKGLAFVQIARHIQVFIVVLVEKNKVFAEERIINVQSSKFVDITKVFKI